MSWPPHFSRHFQLSAVASALGLIARCARPAGVELEAHLPRGEPEEGGRGGTRRWRRARCPRAGSARAQRRADALTRSSSGMSLDERGYTRSFAENLVSSVRVDDFEADLAQGSGDELAGKFRAPYSSSARAVTSADFATRSTRWRRHPAPGTSSTPHARPGSPSRARRPPGHRAGLPSKPDRGLSQDLSLLAKLAVLPPQPTQFLAFRARQTILTTALVTLRWAQRRGMPCRSPCSNSCEASQARSPPARSAPRPHRTSTRCASTRASSTLTTREQCSAPSRDKCGFSG